MAAAAAARRQWIPISTCGADDEPSCRSADYHRAMARDDLATVMNEMRLRGGLVVPSRYSTRSFASRVMGLVLLVVLTTLAVPGSVVLHALTRPQR